MSVPRGFKEPGDKPRRFYSAVSVAEMNDGFRVRLDGRDLHAPKGAVLHLPTSSLANLVAEEWSTQGEVLELAKMHATRLANTAVESVPTAREATAQSVADFAGSDLLCYWATAPRGLAERHERQWGPILDWADAEMATRFVRTAGIVHRPQSPETLSAIRALALELDDFGLAGLAFGTPLFGSAVLALTVARGRLSGEAAYELSRLDEAWQEEQWGVDAEAAERTDRLRAEAIVLQRWFEALPRA